MDTNALNSCLMLAVNLDTPVSLGCLFDTSDLKDTGIELDSHITLLYAQGKEIDHTGLLGDIKDILGDSDYSWLRGMIKNDELYSVPDMFELGQFNNDSDYLILKLRKETELFRILGLLNKSLSIKYGVRSDFTDYVPHLSLAELEPGKAGKYLESETVRQVIQESAFNIEDLFISYGFSNEPDDRKQRFLTSEKCISRYFRLQNLRKELENL